MRDYESLDDRFYFDDEGNFEHPDDVDTAYEDGALELESNGLYYDPDTGNEYDDEGYLV